MTGKNCFPGIPGARWEPLSSACRALVTREHSFTTDTLLLADFSLPRRGEVCADLGTGCGAIPLLWRELSLIHICPPYTRPSASA